MDAGLVSDEDGLAGAGDGRLVLADAFLSEELDGRLEWERWRARGLDEQTVERANAQCAVPLFVDLGCETQTPPTKLNELRWVGPHVRLWRQDASCSTGWSGGKATPL
jgi:hypothetical protein